MASPTVVARSTFVSATTNSTSWTPLSAVAVVPGELLLFVCSADGTPTLSVNAGSSSSGWQKLDQASDGTSAVTGAIFVLLPDDNTAATTTLAISSSASEQYSGILYRIRGADSVDVGTAVTGSSTNSNPPSNTLPVSARDILAIATRSGDSTTVATVAPTNYSNLQSQAGGGTNGVSTNSAERALTSTATEDPGTFTSATEQWVSYTVLLYQSDALATGQTIANNNNTTVTYRGGSVYEIEKTSGANAYNAGAVSSVGMTGDFVLRLRPLIYTNDSLWGVNADPLTNDDYASIDRAFDINSMTLASAYESGGQVVSAFTIATYLWIWRTGTTLGYGTGADLTTAQASPLRTVTDSNTLYFDSALFQTGTRAEALLYQPASATTYNVTVQGQSTPSPGMSRAAGKLALTASTPAPTVARSSSKGLRVASAPSPTLTTTRQFARSLQGQSTPAPALSRASAKAILLSAGASPSLARAIRKALTAASTPAPSLGATKVKLLSLLTSATVSPTVIAARNYHVSLQALTGGVASGGPSGPRVTAFFRR